MFSIGAPLPAPCIRQTSDCWRPVLPPGALVEPGIGTPGALASWLIVYLGAILPGVLDVADDRFSRQTSTCICSNRRPSASPASMPVASSRSHVSQCDPPTLLSLPFHVLWIAEEAGLSPWLAWRCRCLPSCFICLREALLCRHLILRCASLPDILRH